MHLKFLLRKCPSVLQVYDKAVNSTAAVLCETTHLEQRYLNFTGLNCLSVQMPLSADWNGPTESHKHVVQIDCSLLHARINQNTLTKIIITAFGESPFISIWSLSAGAGLSSVKGLLYQLYQSAGRRKDDDSVRNIQKIYFLSIYFVIG